VELPGDDHLPFVGDQDALLDEIAAFLGSVARVGPHDRVLATVLCARVAPATRAADASAFGQEVEQQIAWFRGRRLTFTGDGFFAAFDGPARAIACARALAEAAAALGRDGRFGLHTVECDLKLDVRVAGVAYERARAVCDLARPREVLVSRTVADLVAGSGVEFVDRGMHRLAAGGDDWRVFAVRAVTSQSPAPAPATSRQ
jgi:class 3 adenylate cyclase